MIEVEGLLAAAAADPYADAWDSLHEKAGQERFLDADEAFLIPRLADLAGRYAPADRDNVLMLAGRIAADLDEANWPRYAEAFATMHRLADDWLVTPIDPGSFVYRLQAVLALEGDEVWGAELDRIGNDEVEVECPQCTTSLFVAFGKDGCFATHEDYATKPDVEQTPLLPAEPAELTGVGQRLHLMSLAAGQQSVAAALTYLFGRATCTQCGTTFRVSEQVFRR
ncbi:hypothetical protein ACWT_5794 [Actinoplanes sp. SE50]|uniref:hypothetical protein n=1 Tax=unclassified Actinoplanes TaxID=2626549 RepID=UPI00023ED697|nr:MULTISPECIES: hypothetical protein [unclassified Actinoplanes]AEV86812.1 hypothetical protein ACPL_5925 [Actinoplanes sp. SE50/110]ATO85209.1 hypothetical protein ACWT_5794 [Actinoplanes sp. SE50]SLM02619.1 hypothetical protein ACSP50_5901 [Actinoplanes sp. SE50/110]